MTPNAEYGTPVALFAAPVQGTESDERYTPRWVFDALGETFDLDVAAPVDGGDFVPATRRYTRLEDGLGRPGCFVWCKSRHSPKSTPWADRFRCAVGYGLWLGVVAHARWFNDLAGAASRLWLMRDFAFTHPTHAGRRSSMPLAMAAFGKRADEALERAAFRCGPAAGVLVRTVSPIDGS